MVLPQPTDTEKRQRGSIGEDDINIGSSTLCSSPVNEIDTSDMVHDDTSVVSSDQQNEEIDDVDLEQAGGNCHDHDGHASIYSSKTNKTSATISTAMSSAAHEGGHNDTRSRQLYLPIHSFDAGSFGDFDLPEPDALILLGCDLSYLSRRMQFVICASGVFGFSLLYGYLQELLAVEICNRKLGLFLSMMQFTGYTILSSILRAHANKAQQQKMLKQQSTPSKIPMRTIVAAPLLTYLGISLLRAVDLAMTNLAMQYINYPAKTLMKSSRVIFTMIFGVFILRKKYLFMDYFIVSCMVAGLAVFMHADMTSSAVFQPLGVIMLTISLLCDGAVTNMSETLMTKFDVGQDEFIYRMYSIALIAISMAAAVQGDLSVGMAWLFQPGTYDEVHKGVSAENASWSVLGKIFVIALFSTTGLLSSSCSAAITKHFGALAMSITSTARKATTVFLSFFLFNNECTLEHISGVVIFIAALTAKSLRRSKDNHEVSSALSISMIENVLDTDVPRRGNGENGDVSNMATIMDREPLLASDRRGQPRRTVSGQQAKTDAESAEAALEENIEGGTPVSNTKSSFGTQQRIQTRQSNGTLAGWDRHSGKKS